ncbi:hypothetical protein K7X08_000108 [Anisodus acutangulus]|uniref:Uncharacterized protein n=1 Tax=Anisodus acutangulus TaxID=402998 RepID=A0A9Q1M6C0_9SOLA|nr:hypothetical protein K7X08_000108 [Anisodus acutangulus]
MFSSFAALKLTEVSNDTKVAEQQIHQLGAPRKRVRESVPTVETSEDATSSWPHGKRVRRNSPGDDGEGLNNPDSETPLPVVNIENDEAEDGVAAEAVKDVLQRSRTFGTQANPFEERLRILGKRGTSAADGVGIRAPQSQDPNPGVVTPTTAIGGVCITPIMNSNAQRAVNLGKYGANGVVGTGIVRTQAQISRKLGESGYGIFTGSMEVRNPDFHSRGVATQVISKPGVIATVVGDAPPNDQIGVQRKLNLGSEPKKKAP